MEYHLKWDIELDAESPEEAVIEARKTQQDPGNEATFFQVYKRPSNEYLGLYDFYDL